MVIPVDSATETKAEAVEKGKGTEAQNGWPLAWGTTQQQQTGPEHRSA